MVDLAGTAPASCNRFLSGVKLQFLVPKEGVEPSCLSTMDFESTAYTIPPPGHKSIIADNLYFVNYKLFGADSRI